MFLIDRDCALPRVTPRPRPETWPLVSPAWRAGASPSHDMMLYWEPSRASERAARPFRQASCDDSGFLTLFLLNLQL